LEKLNKLISDENFWKNNKQAKNITKEASTVEKVINSLNNLEKELEDLKELIELSKNENSELEQVKIQLNQFEKKVEELEEESLFNGEYDDLNAVLNINAGAGGVDAHDWAEILYRMYLRYLDNEKMDYEIEELSSGEEAGIKSVSIRVNSFRAYGLLEGERGVHRLVRISPFDSNKRRHTSFAGVDVVPLIEDSGELEIKDEELRIDVYRSSGAGGQHVNTTDSAVRITHLPTNIVVQCQNERSQHKNKETCFNMLKARLYKYEIQKKEEASENLSKSKTDIGWGHQIRSYVLHPYRLVKDNRTGQESSDPDKTLDGNIDSFLESSLYKLNV